MDQKVEIRDQDQIKSNQIKGSRTVAVAVKVISIIGRELRQTTSDLSSPDFSSRLRPPLGISAAEAGYDPGHPPLVVSVCFSELLGQHPLLVDRSQVEVDGGDEVEDQEVLGHYGGEPEEDQSEEEEGVSRPAVDPPNQQLSSVIGGQNPQKPEGFHLHQGLSQGQGGEELPCDHYPSPGGGDEVKELARE